MRSKDRYTVCLSSQSGCALKCAFCATGTMGLGRSLTKGEIYEQLLWAARTARKSDARIRNVVMMGMGEPLQNLDNVLGFCHLANDPDGFGLGARSIAISTAGWLPGIDALIEEPMQVKLAISLHAPDDVLRKGSGTLCEALLMVEAYLAGVLAPNKHVARAEKTFRGKPLESETYIGGKVEALESGVFRSDLPTRFACDPAAYQALIDSVDEDLGYALRTEFNGATPEDLEDYEAVRQTVVDALTALRDRPAREERPLIYHLDVAAMYPNIILTNRLQPSAIVTDEDCAACDFNRPGKTCLRPMEWVWRGETYAATVAEYRALKAQLEAETFSVGAGGQIVSGGSGGGPSRGFGANSSSNSNANNGPPRPFYSLSPDERAKLLKDYCSRVYKRVLDKPVAETRVAGVCQRENDFYVGTVRAFRDRRYEYKALNKKWKGKLDAARDSGDALAAQEAAVRKKERERDSFFFEFEREKERGERR